MNDLKNCPFCGGEAKTKSMGDEYSQYGIVICRICECQTRTHGDKNEVIKQWNTRAEPSYREALMLARYALTLILSSHELSCKGERCQITGIDIAKMALEEIEKALNNQTEKKNESST